MKIIVEVENSEKMEQLRAEVGKITEQVILANTAMKAQGKTTAEVVAQLAPLSSRLNTAASEFKSLEAGTLKAGYGMLNLGYAIDDLQYGFSSIVNNIPQIAMAIGGPNAMAIAGAAGIAAVAINQLYKHWGELSAFLEADWTGGSAERIKELKDRADAATESFQKLTKAKTEWEEKGGQVIKKAIADTGAEKLRTAVAATMSLPGGGGAQDQPLSDEDRRAMDSIKNANPDVKRGVMEQFKKQFMEKNRKDAEELIGNLDKGGEAEKKARSRMQHLIDINPEAFDEEFRNKFRESDPAKVKKKQEDEEFRKQEKHLEEMQQKVDKGKAEEIRKRLQEEKTERLQGLEDERGKVMERKHAIAEELWNAQHKTHPTQIIEGAKASLDLYQRAAGGESQKQLAEKAHKLQEEQNKILKNIDENTKKERRLIIPH